MPGKEMNKTNYHSHCSFCDGRAPMEEFVRVAVEMGYTSYGVSSHAPLPFETAWTLKPAAVPDYLAEVERLRRIYGERLELYAGLEIDYLNEEQHPATDYFQQLPLDYRIGSVHLIYTPEGKIIDTDTRPENFRQLLDQHFRGDLQEMVNRYLEASFRMVEMGGFDFVGHAVKIACNAGWCDSAFPRSLWFRQQVSEFFEAVARRQLMVEVNTKAYAVRGCFFPDQFWFPLLKELKLPVVVNSDAHEPALIHAGREEALRALKKAGFHTVRQMKAGTWIDVKIESL